MTKTIFITVFILTIFSYNIKTKECNFNAQNQDKTKLEASIQRGKAIYSDMCINCHLADGKGVPKVFPPLADSDFLRKNQTKSIKSIKNGISGEIIVNGITYNSAMAPLGLSDKEIADVMNYINNSWVNKIDNFVTSDKVSKL